MKEHIRKNVFYLNDRLKIKISIETSLQHVLFSSVTSPNERKKINYEVDEIFKLMLKPGS